MTSRVASEIKGDDIGEDHGRGSSLTKDLYTKLEGSIRSGALAPGERLPTQKEIAQSESVSRTVVREAVARLAAHGLIVSRQGAGVFVADNAEHRAFQITRLELSELADVIKLLEMRMAVETEMAGLAASRRTTDDIAAIQEALQQVIESQTDPVSAAKADAAFHLAIARATQNDYYVRFVDFLGLRLVPPRNLYLRDQPETAHEAYAAKVHAEHEAIVDAIIRMDPVRAREAARHHMHESLTRHSMLSAAARVRERPAP
ncbi:MAG: FadR/GntR family transcriptional regulator [Sphingomonas sp.]